jgi:hypothetical protein
VLLGALEKLLINCPRPNSNELLTQLKMLSTAADLREYVIATYSHHGLSCGHCDDVEQRLFVTLPPQLTQLTDILDDLGEKFGATADLQLTSSGMTLTLWVDTEHTHVAEKPAATWTSLKAWLINLLIASAGASMGHALYQLAPHAQAFANASSESANATPNDSGWW